MTISYNLKDLEKVASKILNKVTVKTLLFNGEMGSGKTTLIKEIVKQLGVTETVSSPTFSLVNEYVTAKNELVYHFDFYRIKDELEAINIGIEDYFYKNAMCLVEWPKNVENLLPLDAVEIDIKIIDKITRVLTIH